MKNIHLIILLIIIGVSLSSCNLDEIQENPNEPTDVPVQLLLPQAQSYMASSLMNENSATVGIFLQYFEPKANSQYTPYAQYVVDNGFYIDDMWQDYYSTALVTIDDIITRADETGYYHYKGVAQIMMAWTIGTVTDCWGDVPYSEALQGSVNLEPAYDSQKDIYNSIFSLLEQGIENLNKESAKSPAGDDVIFNGDLVAWQKAANSLMARYSIHCVNVSSEVSFDPVQRAITAAGNGLGLNDSPMSYMFGVEENDKSPYSSGKNDIDLTVHNTFKNLLINHPSKDGLIKVQLGSADNGPYIKKDDDLPNVNAYFMTGSETKFIEAEARIRANPGDPDAELAFQEAVEMFLYEVAKYDPELTSDSIVSYTSSLALTGNYEDDLQTIMTHKYISMFGQVEQWSDFRRTGYPELVPNPDGVSPQNANGEIPRRYPYSQNELELNGANVPSAGVNMQARVWWDAE